MKVLIADAFAQTGIDELTNAGCEVTCDSQLNGDSLSKAMGESGCEILIVRSTKVSAQALDASSSLSMVIRAGSGYDTIDVDAATQKGIRVCNCPGMNAVAVAELTLGMMIAMDRRIVDQTADLRRGVWDKKGYSKARGLKGRTLGIVGLGRIGFELAKRAASFDMKLIYSDVITHERLEKELGIRKVSFEQLLTEADFISLHVPGGPSTHHMMGKEQFDAMKPTAFVLNCSRGGIIDEKALAAAVESGNIGGASLDVYEVEPAATDTEFTDPVIKTANVYGTHHVGASTQQAQIAVAEETVTIVQEYMKTGEFLHCVNPPDGQA